MSLPIASRVPISSQSDSGVDGQDCPIAMLCLLRSPWPRPGIVNIQVHVNLPAPGNVDLDISKQTVARNGAV